MSGKPIIDPYLVVDLSCGFHLHLLVWLSHEKECSFYTYSDLELTQTNKGGGSFFQSQEGWQQSLVHISSQNFKIIQRYNASACMAYGRKEDFSTCKKGDQTWLLSNNARLRRHNGMKLFLN